MSVAAVASLRPIRGQCLRQARTGLLALTLTSRSATLSIRMTVPLQPIYKRYQSTVKEAEPGNEGDKQTGKKPEKQKLTFRQFWGRALAVSLRNLAFAMSPKGVRQGFRENPVLISVILLVLIFSAVYGTIKVRAFYKLFYNRQWSRYPEPVATTLRRAVYFTTVSPDPERALKFYKKAMAETKQIGLDPFTDEVVGIRIMVAFWLEKIGNFSQAIEVLEAVRRDCLEWVENMEKQAANGEINEQGRLKAALPSDSTAPRLLSKAVSISVKLGEIFADEHVLDPDNSHLHLVWSVETTLKEFRRRKEEGPKPGEQSWLTPTEVGSTMESLGRDYERKSQFHLAIPLFFQALHNCESPCHRAAIMNNLSACFAQHPLYSPAAGGNPETESLKDLFASSMPNTRQDCLEAASNWANNAYFHANDVKGDDRTAECDEACATALCNWGDVAAMQGKTDLARKKYEQCVELSNKLGFAEGAKTAQDGLKRLRAAAPKS
uniref:TPR domain-containing protein n=1 Tax=Bionectria ochroleuca TaxID=29856 RepID=A0A0B7K995_BIOOC